MISCQTVLEELGSYLDDDLAVEVRRTIEGHLAHCRTCRVLYDSTRRTVQVVVDHVSFDLPDALAERVLQRIRDAALGDGERK